MYLLKLPKPFVKYTNNLVEITNAKTPESTSSSSLFKNILKKKTSPNPASTSSWMGESFKLTQSWPINSQGPKRNN